MSYTDSAQQLLSLIQTAKQRHHRFGVVLNGSTQWQQATLQELSRLEPFERAIELGSDSLNFAQSLSFKQGRKILGQESDLIVADLNTEFDADGLTAACGTLKGGSLLVLLPKLSLGTPFDHWLSDAMDSLIQLSETESVSVIPESDPVPFAPFREQIEAIEAIHRVISGHRKRPLVITADRGRGKSSALGIAAAQIISSSDKKILVTAPNKSAVATLFERARIELNAPLLGNKLESKQGGCIEYIAPDELIRTTPRCDLLLVDEASAIPLPLLKKVVETYHRVCFSTTVHGYEGCGRGFSLKFEPWLEKNRPGWKPLRLTQPIRWNPADPLEAWLFDAFLLNAEVESRSLEVSDSLQFKQLTAEDFLRNKQSLSQCFALLVNAHYQTAPNDLVQLLNDPSVFVYQVTQNSECVAVALAVKEGGLDAQTISDVQLGKRRPAGHLVPVSLSNHLAVEEPALTTSLRVMRIAVHPAMQSKGVGSELLSHIFRDNQDISYLSTSFGATSELFEFWVKNGFRCVRLGVKQDQASGCFSAILVKPMLRNIEWISEAEASVPETLLDTASDYHLRLQNDLLFCLLKQGKSKPLSQQKAKLVRRYIEGGNGFESSRLAMASATLEVLQGDVAYHFDEDWSLLISSCIKKLSWGDLAREFSLTGRKQVEQSVRRAASNKLLINLQCK